MNKIISTTCQFWPNGKWTNFRKYSKTKARRTERLFTKNSWTFKALNFCFQIQQDFQVLYEPWITLVPCTGSLRGERNKRPFLLASRFFRLAKSLWNQGDPEVARPSLITSRRRAIARNVDVFLIFLQVVRPKTPISYSELSLSVHPQRDLSLGQTRMRFDEIDSCNLVRFAYQVSSALMNSEL